MSNNLIQPSLSSGELSPNLHARVDLERYQSGLALCRNFFVDYRGGVSFRAGTAFVGMPTNHTLNTRLIRFAFNTDQQYAIEINSSYIRIIRDGAYILSATAQTILGVTQALAAVVNVTNHGYQTNQQVFISGIGGMTDLNGKVYIVEVVTVHNFRIKHLDGSYVDSTGFPAYTSGGTSTLLFSIPSPYADDEIFSLKFAQSADVMTFVHPDKAQRELRRLAEDNWTLTVISYNPTIDNPLVPTLAKSSNGKTKYAYVITAVAEDEEESRASFAGTITHAVNIGATAGSIEITWAAVTGAERYRIYKANPITGIGVTFPSGSAFGYIGDSTSLSFVDTNIMPDFTRTPPKEINPFTAGNNPACMAYYQQRSVYGGSNAHPETLYFSKVGEFKNFDESLPVRDNDAIEATLASLEINRIKYMIPMSGGLLVMTSGATFQINGGGPDQPLTPGTISATPQNYDGCGEVSPLVIDFNVVYIHAQGSVIRSLTYNFYTGSYAPQDVSIFSQHLLQDFNIVDWAWCEEPDHLIWAARSDGQLVSVTYLPEQKISGLALSWTEGLVKSVCSIQENGQNVLYLVVYRRIDGAWRRSIERMMERDYKYGIEDSWHLDCAKMRNMPTPAASLQLASASGTNVLATASAGSIFDNFDIGKIIRGGGGIMEIVSRIDGTQVRVNITKDIVDVIPGTTRPLEFVEGEWTMAPKVLTVNDLWHLEGHTVVAVADGVVKEGLLVTGGSVSFPAPSGSKIIVGLPYTGMLKTLPLETGTTPTGQGKRKNIHAITVRLAEARGLKAGSTEDNLKPIKVPSWLGTNLLTTDLWSIMPPDWQALGQFYLVQEYPWPATVLGLIPEVSMGDNSLTTTKTARVTK